METQPTISVIVPVRNRPDNLRKCLTALSAQTLAPPDFEIIVVDNASTVSFAELQGEYPTVKWLEHDGPGSYAARNHGVRFSTGRILAFTDSDCIPAQDWLENSIAAISRNLSSIIGGRIELIPPPDRPLNAYEVMDELTTNMRDHQRSIMHNRFAVTANLIVGRKTFDRVGPFNSQLRSSGDADWCRRAISLNESIAYCDFAVVYHPRRNTWAAVRQKAVRVAGGKIHLLQLSGTPRASLLGEIFRRSIFSWRSWRNMVSIALRYPGFGRHRDRLHFVTIAIGIRLIVTLEMIRVFFTRTPSRD